MRDFPEFAVVSAFYSMARPTFRWVTIEPKDHICHEYRYPRYRSVRCLVDPENRVAFGVDASEVYRLIRVGALPTIRRRSRLVVPTHALARLLPASGEGRAR
jgi:hypothetical protein